ncbi:hypothetical protein C9374_002329 [Naegleria lovaniensis]|uniref:Uncharacterized protein n=1 Tax=Naegleria lovaniensis TaxID=51637 RepID=A0AA88GPK5_NAELO|nr:uncharacterized protein C9374_002329 [Naegleria lovaniensis]KAG2386585.1 hypothetical protein C9374_002329 [Naegleria lovaniensis]
MQRIKPLIPVAFHRCSDLQKAKNNLRNYAATGGDLSLVREYVLNPYVYEPLMKFVPMNVAPNVITIAGFICLWISVILTYIHCPTFSETIPNWVFLVNAGCLFAYQTLDNMDGKQARRTKTSSPLGELMDHGVDAVATTLCAISWICACKQGPTIVSYLICLIGYVPFIFATLEEYYIGGLYLGKFNGPIEGLLGFIAMQFLGGIFGHSVYQTKVFGLVPLWAFFSGLTAFGSTYASIENILNIRAKINDNKKSKLENKDSALDEEQKSPCFETDFLKSLLPAIPFIIMLGSFFTFINVDTETVQNYPYLTLFSMAIGFGYLASNLTLAFLVKKSLALFSVMCIPSVLLLLNALTGHQIASGFYALLLCAVATFSIYGNYVVSVCDDICNALNINVFFLPSIKRE